jgi:hypothetical protein
MRFSHHLLLQRHLAFRVLQRFPRYVQKIPGSAGWIKEAGAA